MNKLSDQHYKQLFKASPGKILVLQPDNFVSKLYTHLELVNKLREVIQGAVI